MGLLLFTFDLLLDHSITNLVRLFPSSVYKLVWHFLMQSTTRVTLSLAKEINNQALLLIT